MKRTHIDVMDLCNMVIENKINKGSIQRYKIESDEEIEAMCEVLRSHKLYAVLNDRKLIQELFPDERREIFFDEKYECIANVYWEELLAIVNILSENNIDYAVIKGVPLSCLLYSDPYARGIGDIDIVVKDDDFEKVFKLFVSDGYVRTQSINLKTPIIYYGIHHHEIGLVKECNLYNVAVEIKKRTSATNSFDQWWPHVTKKIINGLSLKALMDEYEILHLLINTFMNNESFSLFQDCRLRDYFDVAYAIKNVTFSWKVILDAAEEMKITHQVAAVLRSVKDLFRSVAEEAEACLSLIEEKYCKYDQTIFYYGMDKFFPTNYGLVENRPRADVSYSIFDRDFSTYQWNKSYRTVLYSKKNPDYVKRQFLRVEESTPFYPYKNEAGIIAQYHFFRNEDRFFVEVNIDCSCKDVFEKNRCNIDVTWYNNDINSPTIYLKSHSPEIKELEEIKWDVYVDGEQCIGYYSGEEYARIMNAESKISAHITSFQENGITKVYFSYYKEQLFFPLDVLLLEVKFVFAVAGDKEDILIDQGTVEHFIECVDHD